MNTRRIKIRTPNSHVTSSESAYNQVFEELLNQIGCHAAKHTEKPSGIDLGEIDVPAFGGSNVSSKAAQRASLVAVRTQMSMAGLMLLGLTLFA